MKKTIVITGASTGIGYACVTACLEAGHRVIATARKETDLKMLTKLGAEAVQLELTSEQSVNNAADTILASTNGKIDTLFNNAGYGLQVAMEDATWKSLNEQHTANVIGPIMFSNRLLPALGDKSQLIFNGSILGVITVTFRGPYCMSKHALEAVVDAYKLELEPLGVRVHLIQPGPIEASFRTNTLAVLKNTLKGKKTRLDYSNHLKRLTSPENTKGTLPASSVAEIFLGIVEETHTNTRYLVTQTAKSAALLKRLLGAGFHRIAKKAEPAIIQE